MGSMLRTFARTIFWLHIQWNRLKAAPHARAIFVFVLVGVTLFAGQTVHAEEPGFASKVALAFGNVALLFAQLLGQLVVMLLEIIIVPLMQYSGFVSSPVVSAGWSLIRDTVNLFFVVVLIIIAFGTILGQKRFQWQQQVPKLMIFAIVINFSKTLCGIMIDFSQVIMLTFANALSNIAGGNFIALFGMNDIFAISTSTGAFANLNSTNTTGPQAFDFLVSGVGALMMMIIVFSTCLVLAAILAWRIVMLWVLITVSPLAWFMGGAGGEGGIIKSNAYSDWWENFKCYLMVGPILTFFLWLTLAVAGAGNIAAASGFNVAVSESELLTTGGFLKIFETSRMLSFIIGIAMIYAGFNAAQTACHSASQGGAITGLLDKAKGYADSTLRGRPAFPGSEAAGRAGRYLGGKGLAAGGAVLGTAGTYGGRLINETRLKDTKAGMLTQQGRAEYARSKAKTTSSPWLASQLGRYATGVEKARAAEVVEAGKAGAEDDRDTLLARSRATLRSGKPFGEGARNAAVADFARIMKDPKARREMENTGDFKKMMNMFGAEAHEASKGDPSLHEAFEELEKTRPDLTGDIDKVDDAEKARALDNAALMNTDVQKQLEGIQSKHKTGRQETDPKTGEKVDTYWNMKEAMERGLEGAGRKKAIKEGMKGVYGGMKKEDLNLVPTESLAAGAGASAMKGPDLSNKILNSKDPKVKEALAGNKNRQELVEKMLADAAGVKIGADGTMTADDHAKMSKYLVANPTALQNIPQDVIDSNPSFATPEMKFALRYSKPRTAPSTDIEGATERMNNFIFNKEMAVETGNTAEAGRMDKAMATERERLKPMIEHREQMVKDVNAKIAELKTEQSKASAADDGNAYVAVTSRIEAQTKRLEGIQKRLDDAKKASSGTRTA